MTDTKADGVQLSLSSEEILQDYRLAYCSRQASLIGRREVMSGKAKFGIFGDGKEVPQLAMARAFKKGDFRSGYYRDQTFMLATGQTTLEEFFAQLYAHADSEAEPASGGRAMNAHFGTRLLNPDGSWKDLVDRYNSSSDVSPTGSQMPRLVGLAYASRLYRELDELKRFKQFSNNGNEIAFGTIGNATTAEGVFWEAINATGVLRSPMVISIWDDEYGISVHNRHQMVKENISELLKGFQREGGNRDGFEIFMVRGWDYPTLVQLYLEVSENVRREHIPAIIHVNELTQPQGHSTSGSHERYKTRERLAWEQEYDCMKQFRRWILSHAIVEEADLLEMEAADRKQVEESRKRAWENYLSPIKKERQEVIHFIEQIASSSHSRQALEDIKTRLQDNPNPLRRDIMVAVQNTLIHTKDEDNPNRSALIDWKHEFHAENEKRYSSHLYSQSPMSALRVAEVKAVFSENSPTVHGFEVLNAFFDAAFARDPRVIVFGEDVGQLGDVNQGLRGLQEKYGKLRVSDTGIRENTIVGQAIGLALRGLRPIAEIQYLDYLLYALQIMSDDLATLHWRTAGGQKAPVIVRTRGHRLEGIWHSGSLMGGVIHLLRGMHVLVPRNMTQAAGFYNTLLKSDDPAVVVEVLNGYRIREKLPDNIGEYSLPLGIPEVLREGSDITLVTYGATCRIVMEASQLLGKTGIEAEVIDIQSLLPFDIHQRILESLQKTGRIVFIDEDVPGGASAYMLREVLEVQGGYTWLDSEPRTLTGKPHRPAYGSDGDYWSKPNIEQVFETVYDIMHESDPARFPIFYR
jgi:2-oxoisovalerate dehydrogenase E1 component